MRIFLAVVLLGIAALAHAADKNLSASKVHSSQKCVCEVQLPDFTIAPAPLPEPIDIRGTPAQPLEVAPDPETHWLTVATIALAALTGCLFVATVCMARVGARQARDAAHQLDLAREEFLALNRPRLSLREAYSEDRQPGLPVRVHYAIANLGNTAATIVACRFNLTFDVCSAPRKQVTLPDGMNAIPVGEEIGAGVRYDGTYEDAGVQWPPQLHIGQSLGADNKRRMILTDSVLQDGQGSAQRAFFFFGRIRYQDNRGIAREMAFYRQLEAGSLRFVPWDDKQLEYSDTNP